jgi:hypothetical protein
MKGHRTGDLEFITAPVRLARRAAPEKGPMEMARQQHDRQARSFGRSTGTTAGTAVLVGAAPADSGPTAAAPTATLTGCQASEVQTRATYRLLLMRGLAQAEAANLTAYLCGIDVAGTQWSIGEINRLLFLRTLARSGRWGAGDGEAAQPDRPARAA